MTAGQHREVWDLASANGETVQQLLLRLLRAAGVQSITEFDLLDMRRGEGLAQRKAKAKSTKRADTIPRMLGGMLPGMEFPQAGWEGMQRAAEGGFTLIINNYAAPRPEA